MFRKIHSQIDLLRQGMPCLYNEIIYLNIYIKYLEKVLKKGSHHIKKYDLIIKVVQK